MRSRADDVRKRIAKRKGDREKITHNLDRRAFIVEDEEKHGFERLSSYEGGPGEGGHPLFNKEIFLFKVLASACLVLIIAILFRNESSTLDEIKGFVTKSMEEDLQFVVISDWYEQQFGKPLALLPSQPTEIEEEGSDPLYEQQYALPAAGRISEEFRANGQRITIETTKSAAVTAMSEGMVEYIGNQEGFGKTVIIQHKDKSETWYGNLEEINVNLYEFVEKGAKVGIASDANDDSKGSFYFAIKKGDDFIDPVQVIEFD